MADLWTHALNLDHAVKESGVAQARVAFEDFEGVKPLMRQVWQGERWKNLREPVRSRGEELVPARVLLGYLRGYFLYREVPENDQAFWPNFLKDLGIEGHQLPAPDEYDRLWEALQWHIETRPHLRTHQGGKRDFIGSLDAIFQFKALRLNALKDSFLTFYQTGELPVAAHPYEQVFRRLREAMEVLLEEDRLTVDLCDQGAVLEFLKQSGIYLGEPNPVRLLFHRSDQALKDLYGKLKGKKPTSRSTGTRFRHKQVRVECLECLPGLAEIRPVLTREPILEGWKVYGKVTLEDGRFKRFFWVPRFTPEGEPIAEELEVTFEEGEIVRFRLHHKAFALRFSRERWKFGEHIELRPIHFDPDRDPLRFSLESGGEPKERLEDLEREMTQASIPTDTVIAEIRVDGRGDDWRKIAVLPVEVRPDVECQVLPEGLFVRTRPPGLEVRIRVFYGERLLREESLTTKPEGQLVAEVEQIPLRIEVCLFTETQSFALAPAGWPERWWRQGWGWSCKELCVGVTEYRAHAPRLP
ncbi:transcription antiterminator BglG [Thermus hydrothermalis]|uniref:transcription antiterminator BglG n=1 Tax=Thermus hydrothermalis TaxID=2908148 RepID=UPI001FA95022|nr:transcription antiterminator BglG [Thermus hydrothermalis]